LDIIVCSVQRVCMLQHARGFKMYLNRLAIIMCWVMLHFLLYLYGCKRCIRYWIRITRMPNNRFVKKCYLMMKLYDNNGHTNCMGYITVLKHLYENGFWYVWELQNVQKPKMFMYKYFQWIKDQYIQRWHIDSANNSE